MATTKELGAYKGQSLYEGEDLGARMREIDAGSSATSPENTPIDNATSGIDGILAGGTNDGTKTEDQFLNDYGLSTKDESRIREDVIGRYQDELNAAKSAYASLLQDTQKQGVGRLGESTAMQGRSGLLGSDFGAAQTEKTRDYNLGQEKGVLQSQALAIANIMNRANQEAANEIASKRAAKESGYGAYQTYKSEAETRKANKLSSLSLLFLNKAIDPTSLTKDELAKVAKGYGVSTQEILNSYLENKTAQEKADQEAAQKAQFNLSEGEARYDAQGNIIAQRSKTYKPGTGGGGIGTGGIYSMFDSKTAGAIIKEGDKFGNAPIVKKYNDIVSAANFINAVDPNTTNSASHQAVIYNFAKMLDPDSVVREGEYATVKKYSQSLLKKYGGEINQAISGKGFLSPEAIQAIQTESKNRVSAYQPQYDSLKNQYKNRINSVAGADVGDMVLLDYEEGYSGAGTGATGKTIEDYRAEYPDATDEELQQLLIEESQ